MQSLCNGTHHVTPRRRQEVLQHVGPWGLLRYLQEIAEYDVTDTIQAGTDCEFWRGCFVAGDLLQVLAGKPGDGPLEVAIFDSLRQPLMISMKPHGPCRASAKVPHSGDYLLRVRSTDLTGLGTEACTAASFKLTRVRQLPKRRTQRQEPLRRPVRPRFVNGTI